MSEATTLEELAARARALANDLFRTDTVPCIVGYDGDGNSSCLRREGRRPLTADERKDGWARRPFWAYDVDRLCGSCQAYWHAEMAAQALHRLYCLNAKYG